MNAMRRMMDRERLDLCDDPDCACCLRAIQADQQRRWAAASELGRAGGASRSAKKQAASRLNGAKGGRPKKMA